jgi:hypothetical protein
MRRLLVLLLAVFTGLAFTVAPATAAPPTSTTRTGGLHFVGNPDLTVVAVDGGYALRAVGEVAGAGRTATAVLTADATVTTGCINRGSKDQQPSGLQRTTTTVTGSQTFQTRSGRGTFDVVTDAVGTAGRTCPDRMQPVLVSATFTNILLTITSQTGTVTATFADVTAP